MKYKPLKKAFLFLILFIGLKSSAQIFDPVQWETSVVKITATEYDLIATAFIERNWHLYAQNIAEGGPDPTVFTFKSSKNYKRKGNTKEEKGKLIHDETFNMKIKYFETITTFKQRIIIQGKEIQTIAASVEYMVCNDTRCLPLKEVALVFTN